MNHSDYWELIAKTKHDANNSCETQTQLISAQLADMDSNEICDFDTIFLQLLDTAYSWHLWAATIIIGGACTDDCFKDFRAWLIGQGKDIYYNSFDNPETLAYVVQINENTDESEFQCEKLLYVAGNAFEKKTGKVLYPNYTPANTSPLGEDKDISEWLKLYPKLAEKYW